MVLGNREYKPCLYLYNKIDTVTIEEIDQLARMPHSMVGSVHKQFNIGEPEEDDLLKQNMWKYLGLTRIYTKRKGESPVIVTRQFHALTPILKGHLPIWLNPLFCPKFAKALLLNPFATTFLAKC